MSQVDELTRILQSLNQVPVRAQTNIPNPEKSDVDENIIILSRNPEMFMKQLKKTDDKLTKKLLLQNNPKVHKDDYSGIFENPLKLELLVAYLQENPTHFMTLLKSGSLTSDQLDTLSNALTNSKAEHHRLPIGLVQNPNVSQQAEAGAQAQVPIGLVQNPNEGFWDGSPTVQQDPVYQMALQAQAQAHAHSQLDNGRIMNSIKQLNDNVTDARLRSDKLKRLLAQHGTVLGLIISKQTGKCIGAIDRNGSIKHCAHREAQSPYDIIVNKHVQRQRREVTQIMKQPGMHVLGQCINVRGQTIGLIVRKGTGNRFVFTQSAHPVIDIPILAIVTQNQTQASNNKVGIRSEAEAVVTKVPSPKEHQEESAGPGAPLSQEEAEEESATMINKLNKLFGFGSGQ